MTTPTPRPRGHWHFGPGIFVARPRLIFSAAAGIVVSLGCAIFAPQLRTSFGLIAGWDTFCAMFLGLAFHSVSQKAPGDIRARSAEQDQGQAVILLLILTACIASIFPGKKLSKMVLVALNGWMVLMKLNSLAQNTYMFHVKKVIQFFNFATTPTIFLSK